MSRHAPLVTCIGIGVLAAAMVAASGADRPTPNKPASPTALEEQKVLDILADLQKNQSRGMMNVPPEDGKLLRILTQAVDAKRVVEIGTSNGYSAIWICLGLQHTGGTLTTFEIDEGRAALARENWKRAGCADRIKLVMGDAHEQVTHLQGPVDLVFIDAEKPGYADYLRKLLPMVRPGGIILAHNTTGQAREMKEFLDAITTHPDLETTFINTSDRGMSISLKRR